VRRCRGVPVAGMSTVLQRGQGLELQVTISTILSDVVTGKRLALLRIEAQDDSAGNVCQSADNEMAVRATRLGAFGFSGETISTEKLLLTVEMR